MSDNIDFSKAFEHENNFYHTCSNVRIARLLAHYELYKSINSVPGAIVECGVFKGNSLLRFAAFRDLLGHTSGKKIIGFDIFGKFPETNYENDKKKRTAFIESAGESSVSIDHLHKIFGQKNIENYEFVKGDILATVPNYTSAHPELKISLLHIDVDIYEPTVTILDHMYPMIEPGGLLVLDDYGVFPGETKAVDEYFNKRKISIQKSVFPFSNKPVFVYKKETNVS
jgi:hypothetical protein